MYCIDSDRIKSEVERIAVEVKEKMIDAIEITLNVSETENPSKVITVKIIYKDGTERISNYNCNDYSIFEPFGYIIYLLLKNLEIMQIERILQHLKSKQQHKYLLRF